MLTFRLTHAEEPAADVTLEPGRHIVGRATDCDVHIDDPTLARRHAAIEVTEDSATVEDLRSTSGTMVDGEWIKEPTQIRAGSLIGMGRVVLKILEAP